MTYLSAIELASDMVNVMLTVPSTIDPGNGLFIVIDGGVLSIKSFLKYLVMGFLTLFSKRDYIFIK